MLTVTFTLDALLADKTSESPDSRTNLPVTILKASLAGMGDSFMSSVVVLLLLCEKVTSCDTESIFAACAINTTPVYPVGAV